VYVYVLVICLIYSSYGSMRSCCSFARFSASRRLPSGGGPVQQQAYTLSMGVCQSSPDGRTLQADGLIDRLDAGFLDTL
jgi:hypothetical protein